MILTDVSPSLILENLDDVDVKVSPDFIAFRGLYQIWQGLCSAVCRYDDKITETRWNENQNRNNIPTIEKESF